VRQNERWRDRETERQREDRERRGVDKFTKKLVERVVDSD